LAENSRSNRNKRKKPFFLGNEIDWERFLKEIQEVTRHKIKGKSEKPQNKRTYPFFAYGVTLGPYGRVYIRQIGNFGCFADTQNSSKTDQKWKPLLDILEEDDKIRVVAELPRANKEQINIIGTEKNLIIQVNRQRQQPAMNLDLPCSVNPETAKATLKNGVLEIVLKKGRSLPFKIKRIDLK
jgi:HSP20 family protein